MLPHHLAQPPPRPYITLPLSAAGARLAREGAVEARVRFAAGRRDAVRTDHAQWVRQHTPHVALVHHEENAYGARIRSEDATERLIRRYAEHVSDLGDQLSFQLRTV